MNLLPSANLLEEAGIGIKGKTLFINMIPAEASTGILLRNDLKGTNIDYELPGYYKSTYQLIARAPNYSDGEALIKSAVLALTIKVETQVETQRFKYMRPDRLPVVFPLSKGSLLEFAVNMECCWTE